MGPQVLLDKSALQSLSQEEAFRLGWFVMVVVPPVLMAEIQADLTKASHARKSQRVALRNEASEQAKKLHSMFSRGFSLPHRLLVLQDLVGHAVEMKGRPIVGGTHVITEDGEKGFWVDDQQEKFLLAWEDGDFSIFDKISAYEWRLSISEIDLAKTRQGLMSSLGSKDLPKTPERLVERVDDLLARPEAQEAHLYLQLGFAHADRRTREAILARWERDPEKRLSTFAPYAAYCTRVLLLFHFALLGDLIGTKATNRIDLEYLYYLPFATAFASGDAVHATLAPLAFNGDQLFISRDALKEDAAWFLAETEKIAERPVNYPPERMGSPVLDLWKKHMKPREEIEAPMPKMSAEEEAALWKKIDAINKARPVRFP